LKTSFFQRYANGIAVVGLSCILSSLMFWASGIAQAKQGNAGSAPVFGSVNTQIIANESKGRKQDMADLDKIVQTMRSVLQQLQEGGARFLTDVEIKELASLLEKPNPTDVEKKRISALEDKGILASGQKRKLELTPNPTDDQKKQFASLTESEQKGMQTIKNLAGEYDKRLGDKELELNNKTVTDIKNKISEVAKEKNISVVFDSQVAIFTANDLTEEVIKRINK